MRRDALVVGINQYPFLKDTPTSKAKHLTTPAGDAEAIAQLLEDYGDFRVKRFPAIEVNGKVQVDQNKLVEAEELEEAIVNLFQATSSRTLETALLFFAGHGLRQSLNGLAQGFLATSDANPRKNLWGMPLQSLWDILENSSVPQQVIWLDCCFSGELLNFQETHFRLEDGEIIEAKRKHLKNYFFITASSDFEVAYQQLDRKHGVLTGAIIKGLNPYQFPQYEWITNHILAAEVQRELKKYYQETKIPQLPLIKTCGDINLVQGRKKQDSKDSRNLVLEQFSQNWFQARLDEVLANAGARYSPELNVELPVAKLFDGLGRTKTFFQIIKVISVKIKKCFLDTIPNDNLQSITVASEKLQFKINQLLEILNKIDPIAVEPINFYLIAKLASESRYITYEYIDVLRAIEEEKKNKDKQKGNNTTIYSGIYSYQQHHLYKLTQELTSLEQLVESSEATLVNVPALLLLGKAGTGKTHIFCDVAQNRVKAGLPTVILLGEQFNDEEPWSQIINFLGLSCTKEEFLTALDTTAQIKQSKALIFIDALNEGEGKKFWKKHFAGMLSTLSHFPHIGIAVSVRSPYEDIVIPKHLDSNKLIRDIHQGFAKHEYQATKTFFDHYGIKHPSVPLLNPEFQNPLFLKLFCLGLKNRGMTEVPKGFYGITSVFNFLVDSVNEKLATEEYLNFDEKSKIVQKAMHKLAQLMTNNNKQWLRREEAKSAVEAFFPGKGYHNSLFRYLLVEGLLAEDRFWQGNDEMVEGIRFSYEKFSDHLITKYLLDKYLDVNNPYKSFLSNQPLGKLVKDKAACWRNRGLLEALSIQVPEHIQKEIAEVAPHCKDFQPIIESFIESLIWRNPSSFTEVTRQYINECLIQSKEYNYQLLNALLTVSTNVNHPYNTEFLHQYLKKFEMADRDSWWSVFLHYQYETFEAVDRLVDWAWSSGDKSHIDDESIRLSATALAWFLTTSNRFLRDRATKALVNLLTPRIHVLIQVIPQFLDVNDLYVLERLFAVAYGCAMRSTNHTAITELAQNVYSWIFDKGEPTPHILLRDYARGVIEVALSHNDQLKIDVNLIKPPYKSEWLSHIPSDEDLKQYTAEAEENFKKYTPQNDSQFAKWRSIFAIKRSLSDSGDFARYIIGTNHNSFAWSSRLLNEPKRSTKKEVYEKFLQSLTQKQQKKWESYKILLENVNYYRRLNTEERIEIFGQEFAEHELEQVMLETKQSLSKLLGKKKTQILEEFVLLYLDAPDEKQYLFDLSIAQRWIFWKVLNLGYTIERFSDFDSMVDYPGTQRQAHKAERIGKKYQWLAYHEFLARVSDNFEFKSDKDIKTHHEYEGSWQIHIRDIDPSCLLRNTQYEVWYKPSQCWWFPSRYDKWEKTTNNLEWVKSENDIPKIEPMIEVINPKDNSKWLVLENHISWNEPTQISENNLVIPRRRISYSLRSYLVNQEDSECVYKWATQQNFMLSSMPESHDITQVFVGEFFWSPSFKYHNIPYFHHDDWTQGYNDEVPKKILVSTDKYLNENAGFDCSCDDSYCFYLPCQFLVDKMNLNWNGIEGSFFDSKGELVALDPSVKEPGPNACLLNYNVLLNFLRENNYDIIWTLVGEKIVLYENHYQDRLELSGAFRIQEGKLKGIVNSRLVLRN